MKTPHPYRLRAYHNPQNADASLIPPGWRMIYADEFPLNQKRRRIPCRVFIRPLYAPSFPCCFFTSRETGTGKVRNLTYIIPVAP